MWGGKNAGKGGFGKNRGLAVKLNRACSVFLLRFGTGNRKSQRTIQKITNLAGFGDCLHSLISETRCLIYLTQKPNTQTVSATIYLLNIITLTEDSLLAVMANLYRWKTLPMHPFPNRCYHFDQPVARNCLDG